MTFRDEGDAARARAQALEATLAEKEAQIEALQAALAHKDGALDAAREELEEKRDAEQKLDTLEERRQPREEKAARAERARDAAARRADAQEREGLRLSFANAIVRRALGEAPRRRPNRTSSIEGARPRSSARGAGSR